MVTSDRLFDPASVLENMDSSGILYVHLTNIGDSLVRPTGTIAYAIFMHVIHNIYEKNRGVIQDWQEDDRV